MCTRAFFHRANSYGRLGKGASVALSRLSKSSRRDWPRWRIGRLLSSSNQAFIAWLSSARLKKVLLRSRARIHRSTTLRLRSVQALHANFHFGFVFGCADPSWNHGQAIMLSKIVLKPVLSKAEAWG